ncbi:MAG: gliding motility-associated C-terminal domain-containing protein [Chitinophagaceae bacterium]|nr:gliding motility-associated C-terminal domain-containing protein [Chitinophagaceae bacterium]
MKKKTILKLIIVLLGTTNCFTQEPLPNDIIINEILFNPVKDGFDYVEGYNRSVKTIFLNTLMIANRNSTSDVAGIKTLTKDPIAINPNSYFIVTGNEKWLRQHYAVPSSAIICQVSSLPSFPDDGGSVIFLRKEDSAIIDEVNYSERWHFRMVKDVQGVALEKINYNFPGQDANNWTSASSASGWGTPGDLNSQFRSSDTTNEQVAVLPKVFTPDNDGVDDFAQVSIATAEQGKIANSLVYDMWGRRVRYLVKNEVLGLNNRFTWDGCDDRSQKLPTGIYIVCTQVFDTKGNNNKFRHCIVLSSLKK